MKTLPKKQSGAILLLVLMFLAIFLIGSVAVMNATEGTNTVLANASFRTSALATSDTVIPTAKTYLVTRASSKLTNTAEANKYYPAIKATTDASVKTAFDWASVASLASGTNNAFNTQYVIERLCDPLATLPIGDVMAHCQIEQVATSGGKAIGDPEITSTAQVLYRITVRVTGPKNAEVYTTTVVSM